MLFLLHFIGGVSARSKTESSEPKIPERSDQQWDRPQFRAPELKLQPIPVEELRFPSRFRAKDFQERD